jgi:hypothetical protein
VKVNQVALRESGMTAQIANRRNRHFFMRKLRYFCVLVWRVYLVGAPGIVLLFGARRCSPFQTISGIRVADPTPETLGHFTTVVGEALALIARCDPIRWKRVQREIHTVVNTATGGPACYDRALRVCMVDVRRFFDANDSSLTVRLMAFELIFQSTLGYLYSKGILRNRQNQQRFDSLCWAEGVLFLQRRVGMTTFPWEPVSGAAPPQEPYWRLVMRELHGVFARDPAAETEVWKTVDRHPEDKL